MALIKRTALVRAPLQKVFDYLNDPNKLVEYWPGMQEVKDVQKLPNGGTCFKYRYKMAGIHLDGQSEDTEIIPLKRMVSVATGGITARVTWEVAQEEFGTRVHFENDYTIPLPVIGKLAEAVVLKLNEHEAEVIMEHLKAHLEA
jgi:carbon monoxide dehydrogenase subunit G